MQLDIHLPQSKKVNKFFMKYFKLILFIIVISSFIIKKNFTLNKHVLLCLTVFIDFYFVSKIFFLIHKIKKFNRTNHKFNDLITQICSELAGDKFALYLMTEIQIILAFFRHILCFKINNELNKYKWNIDKYFNIVVMLTIATVLDFILIYLFSVYIFKFHFWTIFIIHALEIYSLFWFLGEYRLLKESSYYIDDDIIILNFGLRKKVKIKQIDIDHIELLSYFDYKKLKKEKNSSLFLIKENPNIKISLKYNIDINCLFGIKKIAKDIYIYNENQSFKRSLEQKFIKIFKETKTE